MALKIARFASLVSIGICLGPGLAHLLELPHKIRLPRADYQVVQQIYRGWAMLGVLIVVALGSTLVMALLERDRPPAFRLALGSFLCLVAAQLVFWIFTFPANRATNNWTVLPDDWARWRARWEISHAAGALLVLAALAAAVLSVLVEARRRSA
jgi:hypothetical protein